MANRAIFIGSSGLVIRMEWAAKRVRRTAAVTSLLIRHYGSAGTCRDNRESAPFQGGSQGCSLMQHPAPNGSPGLELGLVDGQCEAATEAGEYANPDRHPFPHSHPFSSPQNSSDLSEFCNVVLSQRGHVVRFTMGMQV